MSEQVVTHADIAAVLLTLGKDLRLRLEPYDQDPQYLACDVEELGEYIDLYEKPDTTAPARHVLCCFMLQCLNSTCGEPHPLQSRIFSRLFENRSLHAKELAYWMNTGEPDPENWFPLTTHLLEFERRSSSASSKGASRASFL
jgi:hypothetical protein